MSDTPSVTSRPTECELDLELVELVNWQRFATHLPDLTGGDIEEIKLNNLQNVAQQKLDLFRTWLRKSSDASWNDVISALEKAQEKRLSDTLRKKFNVPTFSLTSDLQINPSIKCPPTPSNQEVNVPSEDAVVTQLKQLHRLYTSLATDIHKKIDELVETGKLRLNDILLYFKKAKLKSVTGLNEVSSVDGFFEIIDQHNDFLDCEFLEMVAEKCLATDDLLSQLYKYMQSIRKFKSATQIKNLKDNLRQITTTRNITTDNANLIVTVKLQDEWGEITLDLVEKLIKNLLHKHYAKLVDVRFGSVRVMLLIPKNESQSLINSSSQRLEFMRLTGVFNLQIGTTVVLQEDENKNFTFDLALLESSQSGNNEAVQFLLDLGVNINYSNSEGKTALMLASEAGHEEVVQTLVLAGADIYHQDNTGCIAIRFANENDDQQIVEQQVDSRYDLRLHILKCLLKHNCIFN